MTKIIIYRDDGEIVIKCLNSGAMCSFKSPKEAASGIIEIFINPLIATRIRFLKRNHDGHSPLNKEDEKELRGYFNVNMLV